MTVDSTVQSGLILNNYLNENFFRSQSYANHKKRSK